MQGVTFDDNHLTYPIRSIDTTANFKCSVYLKDKEDADSYFIGSTDIVLQNDGAATPEDYSIIIENGDQVFQYSESGVTPTSERNLDPQKILPLTCHFYDPAGLEIEEDTYTVEWLVPIENTMVDPPEEELKLNPATGRIELYTERIYPSSNLYSYL